MNTLRTAFIAALFIVCALAVDAQPPAPPSGGKVTEANDCESNAAYFDLIDNEAAENKSIIIIARLGQDETARAWNQRRLHNISAYLHFIREVPRERLIVAEGERVQGRGRVEVYIGGELFVAFVVGRNRGLAGSDCDPAPGSMFYPMYQEPKVKKQKEGKKRMKRVGRVEIPQEAFLAVLLVDE